MLTTLLESAPMPPVLSKELPHMWEISAASACLRRNIVEINPQDRPGFGYTAPAGEMTHPITGERVGLYPHMWFWDIFQIAAQSPDIKQSLVDVYTFMESQRPDGFLSHIYYHEAGLRRKKTYFPGPKIYFENGQLPKDKKITSKIIQPPNAAWGIWELAAKLEPKAQREFISDMFPALMAYHKYLYSKRTINGLVINIHPWEGGDDNSRKWDSVYSNFWGNDEVIAAIETQKINGRTNEDAMFWSVKEWLKERIGVEYERLDTQLVPPSQRPVNDDYDKYLFLLKLYQKWGWDETRIMKDSPFRVADPMMNAMLLRSNKELLKMALLLGDDTQVEKINQWTLSTLRGMESLWDEENGYYFARDLGTEELIRIPTNSSYMVLFSESIPEERAQRIIAHLEETRAKYPHYKLVPSTDPAHPSFDPERYWQGPVWPSMNYYVARGLDFYNRADLANMLRRDSIELILGSVDAVSGEPTFHEYYTPEGRPLGSPGQSWTASSFIDDVIRLYMYESKGLVL